MNRKRSSFKRWHPLLGEWVIYAPATAVRPWSGAVVETIQDGPPQFDPACYLCPGVTRAAGTANPNYTSTFVFDNDFASLTPDSPAADAPDSSSEPARGVCRVVCFNPRHDLTLAEMNRDSVIDVIGTFCTEYADLSSREEIAFVLPFENKGTAIGVSNPHPHGQIYATDFVPRIPETMYRSAERYHGEHSSCIFCGILEDVLASGRHVVCRNEHAVAFVPPFARHSFEVHIYPTVHVTDMTAMSMAQRTGFAAIYHEMLVRYDNLFRMPFPNITMFYNAPCAGGYDPAPFHFHVEFCPPMRSRDKLKYLAGFETGTGNIINPAVPEESAATLRSLDTIHYTVQEQTR